MTEVAGATLFPRLIEGALQQNDVESALFLAESLLALNEGMGMSVGVGVNRIKSTVFCVKSVWGVWNSAVSSVYHAVQCTCPLTIHHITHTHSHINHLRSVL
jgi:hypothetical protein